MDKDSIMGTTNAIVKRAMEEDPGELKLKIRLGLDIHGTIDADPIFFSELSLSIRETGNEVFIVTGREIGDYIRDKLHHHKIVYDSILSITSYHMSAGTPIKWLDEEKIHPWIDEELWNSTKFKLCTNNNIDIMVDDSPVYGKYFSGYKKPFYVLYTPQMREFLKILFYHGGYKL